MSPRESIRVEVVLARPRHCESVLLELSEGASVADAHNASGLGAADVAGYAVFGVRVTAATPLHDGDRLELLRPLVVDPKEARRRRAAATKPA